MSEINYYRVTGVIFGIVAIVHLLRLSLGWSVNFGGWDFPVWLSALAALGTGYLSYTGCKKGKFI
ncbi:hypothetical protein A2159_02305 [Candidatus Woesebacteria bacterium RBG_13_34_9]|uniref:Uncharacterized protein n=1 Tax=Candidatus Woesebacteria bacterium RBG_13_34_9 TaxID=1802477 RepID=A0A1F7X1F8_9BACT|nr:MAG: hypothetical protein A2159_02305 [Candidatus Woesebacteria bacterium RBG_13_34_9]